MKTSSTRALVGSLFLLIVALFVTQFSGCSGDELSNPTQLIRPFALRYADGSVVYPVGQPIIPNEPSVRGQAVSYSVEPALPPGLTLDPHTGVISGTPSSATVATIYVVKATNSQGSATGRLQIEISDHVLAPDGLSYPVVSAIYEAHQAILPNTPVTTGGAITEFTVNPGLPSGLSLNPQTGVISGTPLVAQPATQYTVTGANSAGNVQTNISIAVQQQVVPPTEPPSSAVPPTEPPPVQVVPPSTVAYTDAVYVVGQPIVPNVPTLTGGVPTQFAVSPTLPAGLDLDNVTGAITGVPTAPQAATQYTVTASNPAGQAQTTLSLTVTAAGTWTPSGSLNNPRVTHTASLRLDGTVLVAGGFNTGTSRAPQILGAVESRTLAGIWLNAQAMRAQRFLHTSTTLQDGRVLVVGGAGASGSGVTSVEIFDTQWSIAAPTTVAHVSHTATLLKDGRVLVVGGNNGSSTTTAVAELYNPGTGTWTQVASLNTARAAHTATLLADGRVLVAGGENNTTGKLASAEVYDPIANTWTAVPDMSQDRAFHTASLLADGTVLVAGGSSGASGFPTNQVELFNPQTMSWQPMPPMVTRRDSHTATVMQNGQVVVVGGSDPISGAVPSVEIFDPASGQWLAAASMANSRTAHTATLLPDGRLLVVGGKGADFLASSEVFDISQSGTQAAANVGP
ncbi:kelch repeat-containing protein [Paraburkholderia sp. RL18-085-BIA-A]|uniref:kelch repeat-containing protein n=1 Tax=Paraburkholderia sp. RL18-085-BIA-A TaxID=3031633 RepID=UPI0038BBAEED